MKNALHKHLDKIRKLSHISAKKNNHYQKMSVLGVKARRAKKIKTVDVVQRQLSKPF